MTFGGFYREWSHAGSKSEISQQEGLNIFLEQIEKATVKNEKCVILGDANLCSTKALKIS